MSGIRFETPSETISVHKSELLLGISEKEDWITFDELKIWMDADGRELLMKLDELQEEGQIICKEGVYYPSAAKQVRENLTSDLVSVLGVDF